MEQLIAGQFDEYGFPYLEILVGNKRENLFSKAKAIIDTGAAHCMIREDLALDLKLEELRIADYLHPVFGKMKIREFIMDLQLNSANDSEGAVIERVRAGTLVDLNYPASVIIGVELLKHCWFEYRGQEKTFKIAIKI
jgi:hypothetical protein